MWTGLVSRCVTVELDFVFHVCESGRHCMGVYAYEVGTPRFVLGDYAANDIYRSVHFYNGIRGRLHEVVRLNFFSDWQNFFSVERH